MKYQDLRIEIEKLWDVKAVIVAIVANALGQFPMSWKNLNQIGLSVVVPCLQKAALLGTASILRRAVGISRI